MLSVKPRQGLAVLFPSSQYNGKPLLCNQFRVGRTPCKYGPGGQCKRDRESEVGCAVSERELVDWRAAKALPEAVLAPRGRALPLASP